MKTMATLYIRDVTDEVATILKRRAAAQGMSLSAYVAAELTRLAAGPTNAEVVAKLKALERSTAPTTEEVVAEVRAARR